MTTNGIRLPELLPGLIDAGLRRLNISIDTLRRDRFHELTRRDRLDDVLEGIAAAAASGLRPLKLNAVAMRDVNDDELVDLVEFALAHDAQMRFIEQMPLDAGHTWDRSRDGDARRDPRRARRRAGRSTPVPGRGGAPAERWMLDGGPHTVGVIASVTAPFCGDCDRLRLTADGQLRNCLFSTTEYDLLPDPPRRPRRRGGRRRHRPDAALLRPRQAARSRDQRPVVPAAGARHERDRRLSMGRLTDAHAGHPHHAERRRRRGRRRADTLAVEEPLEIRVGGDAAGGHDAHARATTSSSPRDSWCRRASSRAASTSARRSTAADRAPARPRRPRC